MAVPGPAPASALAAAANPAGGWGYYAGKTSRLEPTCWALLALDAPVPGSGAPHAAFLARAQQPSGWLLEDTALPVNIAFNALAAFTWLTRPALAPSGGIDRLLTALVASKGLKVPQTEGSTQDNSLQGWSWIDATFSWAEPTAWGVIALSRARRTGRTSGAIDARIDEAVRVLENRACRDGGWNYGNASVMQQDLRPYAPTTALALLALQDRRSTPVVQRGLSFLESHWMDEISAASLGLALICLDVFGRDVSAVTARLTAHLPDAVAFGNLHGLAVASLALSKEQRTRVFTL